MDHDDLWHVTALCADQDRKGGQADGKAEDEHDASGDETQDHHSDAGNGHGDQNSENQAHVASKVRLKLISEQSTLSQFHSFVNIQL